MHRKWFSSIGDLWDCRESFPLNLNILSEDIVAFVATLPQTQQYPYFTADIDTFMTIVTAHHY
jgi:hypothetical protein